MKTAFRRNGRLSPPATREQMPFLKLSSEDSIAATCVLEFNLFRLPLETRKPEVVTLCALPKRSRQRR
jgi:hypothetical protein